MAGITRATNSSDLGANQVFEIGFHVQNCVGDQLFRERENYESGIRQTFFCRPPVMHTGTGFQTGTCCELATVAAEIAQSRVSTFRCDECLH
jgi:hypothetical protein